MWENETVVLLTSLKKRILDDKKTIRFSVINDDKAVPDFIKRVIAEKVDYYKVKEAPLTVKGTPHFDLQKADMALIKENTEAVILNAAIFTREEIERYIQEALIIRLDFMVKPVSTMSQYLFQNEMSVEVARIPDILLPFRTILSYPNQLMEICEKEGLAKLKKSDYDRITHALFSGGNDPEKVTDVLKDFTLLTEYLSETKGEEVTRIEGEIFQEFLSDRYLDEFRKAIDVEIKLGNTEFTATDIEMILRRYIELRAEFGGGRAAHSPFTPEKVYEEEKTRELQPEDETSILEDVNEESDFQFGDVWEEVPVENENTKLAEDLLKEDHVITDELSDEAQELTIEPAPAPEADEEPLMAEVEPAGEEPIIAAEEEETGTPELVAEETASEEEKPMRIIRREKGGKKGEGEKKSDNAPVTGLTGLRSMLDEKTEKLFIKKLFSGDMEAFTSLFDKLDESESWRVAKILIDNELFKRDVDPFSREAIKLVDMVYSRYYPEESVGG
ncbi:hypothetical protein JXO52_03060 [bacterium]|nr:hypothetical protein [bacterium]